MKGGSAERQLAGFIAKFTPEIVRRTRAILEKMRARLPGSLELVYDNYNALAIGFGATERASDAIFSIAVFPRRVSLVFIQGVGLRIPTIGFWGAGSRSGTSSWRRRRPWAIPRSRP